MNHRVEPGTTFIIEEYADEDTYKEAALKNGEKYDVYEQYEFYVPYYRIPTADEDDQGNPIIGPGNLSEENYINQMFAETQLTHALKFGSNPQQFQNIYEDKHKDWKGPIISEIEDEPAKKKKVLRKVQKSHSTKLSAPPPPVLNKTESITNDSTKNKWTFPIQARVTEKLKKVRFPEVPPEIKFCSFNAKTQPNIASKINRAASTKINNEFKSYLTPEVLKKNAPNIDFSYRSSIPKKVATSNPNVVDMYGQDVLKMINQHNQMLDKLEGQTAPNLQQLHKSNDAKVYLGGNHIDKHKERNPFNFMQGFGGTGGSKKKLAEQQDVLRKLNDVFNYVANVPNPAANPINGEFVSSDYNSAFYNGFGLERSKTKRFADSVKDELKKLQSMIGKRR